MFIGKIVFMTIVDVIFFGNYQFLIAFASDENDFAISLFKTVDRL